jgi:hypothetical protein
VRQRPGSDLLPVADNGCRAIAGTRGHWTTLARRVRQAVLSCLALICLSVSCARPVAPEIVYDEKVVQKLQDGLNKLAPEGSGGE